MAFTGNRYPPGYKVNREPDPVVKTVDMAVELEAGQRIFLNKFPKFLNNFRIFLNKFPKLRILLRCLPDPVDHLTGTGRTP